MGRRERPGIAACAVLGLVTAMVLPAWAGQEIDYRVSVPAPEHHWLALEASFTDLPSGPLRLHMSRSSPGRYALHEFAKNVYDVSFTDGAGRPLQATRPTPHEWDVAGHDGTVRVAYRVFGNRVDGTYLAVDTSHAHLNMPAVLMWATGLELRPARLTFVRPASSSWVVATQLFPTDDPLVFRAPNLQYLMDSPAEFGPVIWRTFELPDSGPAGGHAPTFRIALHQTGADADADAFAEDLKKIVAAERRVFGELPPFEPGTYTFIADYLPWADGDGMEHRNSTVMTSRRTLAENRTGLLETAAHEFFHCWNVERIRPRTLEPFDFERENMSGELWLAEGVTSYYNTLIMARTGLSSIDDFAHAIGQMVAAVESSPATRFRSAEDMSRLAPFVDAASWIDRTDWGNTFISYYTFGAALGLGIDLSLREHTAGRVTLDDFMRAMWQKHGRPGGSRPGYVDRPYSLADVRDRLAEVSGDRAFADDLVARYIDGHETMDYAHLLRQAGLVHRRAHSGGASLGALTLDRVGSSLRLTAPTPIGSAAYAAGLDEDDEITTLDREAVAELAQIESVLKRHKPGDRVGLGFLRHGAKMRAEVDLEEDTRLEVVTVEQAGNAPTAAQQSFRDAWIGRLE
jgi:predicted metalloprotease with PDZ domain